MDTEIYEKAHNIMRLRREKARDENDRRIQEINQKIPEIKEINSVLFNVGKELIGAIANGHGKDVTAEIERIKENNIRMQNAAKQLLISHGYPPDYLNIHYACPKCDDTGYIDDKFCDCIKQVFGQLRAEEFNRYTYLELSNFESFNLKYYSGDDYCTMKKILDFTRNYAETFTPGAKSIMMSGSTGLGKTHLSLAVADRVIRKGFAVVYDSVINILDNIENEHYSEHSRETLDAVLDADLLILDDLGTEQESKFFKSKIFNIIDTRINRKKSTIISTNLNLADISKRYDQRIISRLSAKYTQMQFSGKDVRLQIRCEQFDNNKNYR